MKLINPHYEIIEPLGNEIKDIFEHIELCGRTCYKSEDKITEGSCYSFIDRLKKSEHLSVLEHGTIYLRIPISGINKFKNSKLVKKYKENPYTKCVEYEYYTTDSIFGKKKDLLVTTNFRVITENEWAQDLQYMCSPLKHHHKRYTVKFTCNRQIANEFVRHRKFSFSQESTRYCLYTANKFGKELTFILPLWCKNAENEFKRGWFYKFKYEGKPLPKCSPNAEDLPTTLDADRAYLKYLKKVEDTYIKLIDEGWQAQQAATVLPNSLKTELIMTGFFDDWLHFFDLRSSNAKTGKPHPQAAELATPLKEKMWEMEINRKKFVCN